MSNKHYIEKCYIYIMREILECFKLMIAIHATKFNCGVQISKGKYLDVPKIMRKILRYPFNYVCKSTDFVFW
jgi:hypothetical protein